MSTYRCESLSRMKEMIVDADEQPWLSNEDLLDLVSNLIEDAIEKEDLIETLNNQVQALSDVIASGVVK
jgi:hypothetical protein